MNTLPILTSAQTYACDSYTMETLGVPSQVLMERAARKCAGALLARDDLFPCRPVLLLCGSGNNGGDGFAMARFLTDGSVGEVRPAVVLYTGRVCGDGSPDEGKMSAECARQYGLARDAGVKVVCLAVMDHLTQDALSALLTDGAGNAPDGLVIADAVFGIGLDRPVSGRIGELFDCVRSTGWPVLAVDIPSGVMADTGCIPGSFLSAALTVTMQALKPGLLLYPGADASGDILVADLGISLEPTAGQSVIRLCGDDLLRTVMPPRTRRTNKGSYGRVSLTCGSVGMCGAALLATSAALRSGAGLAQTVTPEDNRVILQSALPEAILSVYDGQAPDDQALLRCWLTPSGTPLADGYVVGCGLGTSDVSVKVLKTLLDALPAQGDGSRPLVLDADALNILAKKPLLWQSRALSASDRRVVITPHPVEMARLCGKKVPGVLADLVSTARDFAAAHGVTVVLKDAHTVVASPEGETYICAAGNAGMAKGGSGDVLAGLVGSLMTQNRRALEEGRVTAAAVAAAAVYLHASAGDEAARVRGEYAMLPSDLIAALPSVTKTFSLTRTEISSC